MNDKKQVKESLISIQKTITLIEYYNFDLGHYHIRELIIKWSKIYDHEWLPLAVMEAIYEGRLKAISVEQILNFWLNKGKVCKRFNREFERLVTFNVNFHFLTEDEFKAIFFSDNITNKAQYINHKNGRKNGNNGKVKPLEIIEKNTISEEDYITNFQPLEDYSSCFNKLKSFVEQTNSSDKLSVDDHPKE